jgi:YHS domain-containing protein
MLVILFYIGYRLIVGSKKKKSVSDNRSTSSRKMPTSDTLVEDPVCNKLVPQQQAITYESEGTTHYFCSKECCKIYRNQNGEQ